MINKVSIEPDDGTPISDKEAWLRIFEVIRPTIQSTELAIGSTNRAFDAMKNKLEVEL